MLYKPTYKNRYKGLKGRYWDYLSDFVRMRDYIKYKSCISSGKVVTHWKELQAGHYAPASNCGFDLLFDIDNIHGESAYSNGFDEGHLIGYRKGLISRYGIEFVESLEDRYNAARYRGKTTKEWSKKIYKEKIAEIDKACYELSKLI